MSDPAESFYAIGGTLPLNAPSYVERRADRDLFDGLVRGEYCYVLTSRQMGKSSLMVRAAARLRDREAHVVALDLTAVGQNLSPDQWYDGLLLRVGRQVRLEDDLDDFWTAHSRLGPTQRFFTAIRDVVMAKLGGPLVVFVDELDTVRSLPFSTDEFFAAIRECFTRRVQEAEFQRLTFCLLGVATPSDLIQDTRMTPFNIARRIELHDFQPDEAMPLALALGRPDFLARRILKRILFWTGGHPYLTQRLCRSVAQDKRVIGPRGVDRLCREIFFSNRARERDDNLLFVRERILRSEADRVKLLRLYRKVHRTTRISGLFRLRIGLGKVAPVADEEANPLVAILRLSGIVRVEGGLLKVRNWIYYRVFDRDWIFANMPEVEMWRIWLMFATGLRRAVKFLLGLTVVLFLVVIAILLQIRPLGEWLTLARAKPDLGFIPRHVESARSKPVVPPRDPAASDRMVDLTDFYTASLIEGWHDGSPGNTLAALPAGLHTFEGVAFDVRGIIQLAGRNLLDRGFPSEIDSIPIGRRCARIHFLHATGWQEEIGTTIARYVVHFEDGRRQFIPVVFGQDVLDWHPQGENPGAIAGARLAWEKPAAQLADRRQLFLTTWSNPWPQVGITQIDYISAMTEAAPFLIAMTVDPSETDRLP